MKLNAALQQQPLRHQLMCVLVTLSIATTAITAVTLASLSSHRINQGLRDKSVQYARQLQRELAPVVAFNDHLTAREVFQSVMADHDVDGLGVYREDGELLEGVGIRPNALASIAADVHSPKGHVIAVADIKSREGRSGRVYVGLSAKAVNDLERRNAWFAAAIAAAVVLCALVLAMRVSHRIAARLGSIADAAKRMAAGNLEHTALDESAKDEIGALARAFNFMVLELSRISTEHERLVATERERLESWWPNVPRRSSEAARCSGSSPRAPRRSRLLWMSPAAPSLTSGRRALSNSISLKGNGARPAPWTG